MKDEGRKKLKIDKWGILRHPTDTHTVVKHVVVFAVNANFLNRTPVLKAIRIVSKAWSTMNNEQILHSFDVMSIFLDSISRA